MTLAHVTFVTRAKSNLAFQVERVLRQSAQAQDALVWIGRGEERQQVRLISVLYHGTWQRSLTNERDPLRLPPEYAVALYWQRWRIEDGYHVVKRLLGLAYFWAGSANGVQQRDGGHADFLLAEEWTLVAPPDDLSYLDGAMVACGVGTAYAACLRAAVSGRDTVLITGLGPMGLGAAMLCQALGARVVDVGPDRVPKKILSTGAKIPAIGLGTFSSDRYLGESVAEAVHGAIAVGYRHIDCAAVYRNENLIGQALHAVMQNGLRREELWITSKLWRWPKSRGSIGIAVLSRGTSSYGGMDRRGKTYGILAERLLEHERMEGAYALVRVPRVTGHAMIVWERCAHRA